MGARRRTHAAALAHRRLRRRPSEPLGRRRSRCHATGRHYLVVNYCKRYGIITSVSIAAHGCDTGGLIYCNTGPAWQTGGGVGSSSATFEGHALWIVTTSPFYTNNDVLYLTVPAG